MKPVLVVVFYALAFTACKNEEKKVEMPVATTDTAKFTPAMVVNTKDYSCGMPVTAGISDTCHYEGKAYGFCSTECKNEFLKDPKKYLVTK
ncbi:MAG: hypothetical protein RLY11_1166 [Bacteroidota bacterium]|jgi:YHS domain-containing protein|nr:YHS domain-containing protein [Chitinophagia bacterium]